MVQGASALNPSLWPPGEIINMPMTTATSQKLKTTTKNGSDKQHCLR